MSEIKPDLLQTVSDKNGFYILRREGDEQTRFPLNPDEAVFIFDALQQYLFVDN